jgi:adenylate cyclase
VDLGLALAGMVLGLFVRYTTPAIIGSGAGLLILAGSPSIRSGRAAASITCRDCLGGSAGLTNRVIHAASNRCRALLRKSFERYLPPAVIAQMVASERLPRLGGERPEISVLFSDVGGSTTLGEGMEPNALATVCNDYFEGLCAAIFDQGGMVTEFVGHGVVAFFGAPHQQRDHADRAVSAALAIDQFACRFSAGQKARSIDFGHTRIGIHTSSAMVGNIRTRARLKYGAQGDVLSTGGRLDTLNKTIGTRVCVSGDTVSKARQHRFLIPN